MSFFKRFAFTVKDDESVICTAEELEQLQEEAKKRKKKRGEDDGYTDNGAHSSDPS